MTTFTWLGGSLSTPSDWGNQPDPKNPVEPGAGDDVILNMNGTLTGSVSPDFATLTGTFMITTGVISTNLGINITNGSVTQTGGGLSGPSSGLQLGGSSGAVTYVQNGGNNSYNFIEFNSGSYELDSGTLTVGATNEYIADNSNYTASFLQKGGTHTVNGYLLVGYTATGSYDLQGGTLTTQIDYIGQNGKGTFTQTGGSQTVSNRIVLGIDQNSGMPQLGDGTYTLGGTGSLSVQTVFIGSDPNCTGTFNYDTGKGDSAILTVSGNGGYPGLIVGGEGDGTFNQGGGSVSTTIAVGFRATGNGTYNLTGGKFASTDEEVGVAGTGMLVQSGGTDTVTGKGLIVGVMAGSTGTVHLDGGTLQASSETIASGGTGAFYQTAGTNTVNKTDLIVGYGGGITGAYTLGGSGKLTVAAGNLRIGALANSTGIFSFNTAPGDAAALTVTNGSLTVGDAGTATFTLGAGAVSAASEIVGNSGKGTFNQTAGTNTVTKLDLVVGNAANGDGTYNLGGAGALTISAGNLTVGAQPNAMGAFNFNTAPGDAATITLTKGSLTVGDLGTGTFTMGGGTLESDLTLGSQVGGDGTFTLTGGAFTATGADELIGDAGTGTFMQTAGTNTIDNGGLFLGNSNGGSGTYMLGGTGALKITSGSFEIAVGGKSTATFDFNTKAGDAATISIDTRLIEVGVHGMGTFIQGGGALGAKVMVGGQVGSTGKFELDGGTVTATGQVVGNNGTGTFTINGAKSKDTIAGGGDLILGAFAAGGGKFNLNSGAVAGGSELIGYAGQGAFTQKAGSNKLTGSTAILDIGVQTASVGTYTLSGGTLSTIMETIGDSGKGTFTQSGKAVHTVNGKLIIGNTGTGTFTLSGGTVAVKGIGAATKLGVNAKSSGTLIVTAAKLTTPSLAIGSAGAGQVTINAGGTIAVAKKVTIASGSTLTLVKGSLNIGSSVISKTGTVSIGKGGSLTGAGKVTGAVSEIATGTLQAKGGVLTLAGPIGGGGALGIAGGATLDLVGKDANAVKFLAATGTLRIEKTATVTGKIAQLQIGDVIDIAGITITKASLSGSKLTLTKSGGGTIVLTLSGTFTGDKFAVQSDNHGGSDILLQKASAAAPSSTLFSQYVAAGFQGADAGHGATAPVAPPSSVHLDLAHGHA